jgi:hypothetical protein
MANSFQGFDRFSWQRSLTTSLPKLLKDIEDATKRNHALMALMDQAGRISTGHGGEGLQWVVKYKDHATQAATGENARSFVAQSLFKTGNLDWRGYECVDSIKRRELEKNKGESAIVKVVDQFAERIKSSLMEGLASQWFVDGEHADNERFWHGLKTLAQSNGQTLTLDTNVARTANAADKVIAPYGSYGGINMGLGYYGGAQTAATSWPEATADKQYDFWSSLQVVTDSTAFSGSTAGAKMEQAIRYGITHAQRNSSIDGQITNVMLDRNKYIELKDHNDGRQTIEVTNAPGSLRELGFLNSYRFDGVEVSYENSVPVGYGFGINLACMELMGLTESLFDAEGGPQYDLATQSLNCVVSTLSNIKYKSPRNFVVWKPLSAA